MAEEISKPGNDLDSLREELYTQLNEMQRRALDITEAEVNNIITTPIVTDDEMDVSHTDYSARMLALEKQTHDLCLRMRNLLVAHGPDFPKAKVHAFHNLMQSVASELQSKRLLKISVIRQRNALKNRIALLEEQKACLEKAFKGMTKTLEVENENKKAVELLQKVHHEFAESRKDLHDVVGELFPDDDDRMRNLLADLTKARFSKEEDEQWADISDHHSLHVELLIRNNLLKNKPGSPHLAAFTF